jgi:hypothetical protein
MKINSSLDMVGSDGKDSNSTITNEKIKLKYTMS